MNKTSMAFSRSMAALSLAFGLSALALPAQAQDSTNQVAVKTDWSVFAEDNPKECWGVTAPKESVNTRDGKPVSVQRSEIRLFVTFRPGDGAKGEVSFTGGYPFAPGSTVKADVDGTVFELFVEGEWAWPGNAEDDAALLAALKRGSSAVMTARSARGTQTVDTFSLSGFTAALAEAEGRCK